jgi:uncharacterized protein YndB with AHSA1/START domain
MSKDPSKENAKPDGRLDLVLTRTTKVPRAILWRAWTEPEHLMKWFCPRPWQATACEIELRPGGKFRTVMQGPNGEKFDSAGCYLEVVPQSRLIWTSALGPGYRPATDPMLSFTAILTFEDAPEGARFTAVALHKDDADRQKHAEMGFEQGWGKAFEQLVEIADSIK